MTFDPKTHEVQRLVDALTGVPGETGLEVLTRRFPRLGPAEPGTGYRESVSAFEKGAAGRLDMSDVDEVVIKIHGRVDPSAGWGSVRDMIDNAMDAAGVESGWEVRARFDAADADSRAYEAVVFTNFLAPLDG